MTLEYGLLGLSQGGAKAGLRAAPRALRGTRSAVYTARWVFAAAEQATGRAGVPPASGTVALA